MVRERRGIAQMLQLIRPIPAYSFVSDLYKAFRGCRPLNQWGGVKRKHDLAETCQKSLFLTKNGRVSTILCDQKSLCSKIVQKSVIYDMFPRNEHFVFEKPTPSEIQKSRNQWVSGR